MLGNGQIVPYREKLDTYAWGKAIVFQVVLWYHIMVKY
jgi:hypothetical protein